MQHVLSSRSVHKDPLRSHEDSFFLIYLDKDFKIRLESTTTALLSISSNIKIDRDMHISLGLPDRRRAATHPPRRGVFLCQHNPPLTSIYIYTHKEAIQTIIEKKAMFSSVDLSLSFSVPLLLSENVHGITVHHSFWARYR